MSDFQFTVAANSSNTIERSRAREAALQYRVRELVECNPRDLDQVVSMLLHGIPLAAGSEVFWKDLAEQLPAIAEQLRGFRTAFGGLEDE